MARKVGRMDPPGRVIVNGSGNGRTIADNGAGRTIRVIPNRGTAAPPIVNEGPANPAEHQAAFTSDDVLAELMGVHQRLMGGLYANLQDGQLFPGRMKLGRMMGLIDGNGNGRDLAAECGYPMNPDVRFYKELYGRVGIAKRANDIWPDECFAVYPQVYESSKETVKTEFEKAWKDVEERCLVWHYLHRIDRLSGIGQFGVLVLGISDGRRLDQPAAGIDPRTGEEVPGDRPANVRLEYIRAYDESLITVAEEETDDASPRVGYPRMYEIETAAPGTGKTRKIKVHWTRVIHVADNRDTSETYGVPRLQNVLEYIWDIRKTGGASAEMFYKGGFPGYQFKTDPAYALEANLKRKEIRAEIKAYMEGLQRFLTAVGGEWASLAPQVADPTNHITQYLILLGATIGVPVPILLGHQSGHLAGMQDTGNWKDRVRGRQSNYLEPMLVRPFIVRLISLGCLPRPKQVKIVWRDLKAVGEKDRAEIALKMTQALMQYVSGGCEAIMPLVYFFTHILGLSNEDAQAIIAEAENLEDPFTGPDNPVKPVPETEPVPQGGGRTRNAGSSGGRKQGTASRT